jgi:hypothetical protein
MTWFGWVWRGDRWERVCDGESIRDVARKLNRLVKDVPTHKQAIVGGGACPTWRPIPCLRSPSTMRLSGIAASSFGQG